MRRFGLLFRGAFWLEIECMLVCLVDSLIVTAQQIRIVLLPIQPFGVSRERAVCVVDW